MERASDKYFPEKTEVFPAQRGLSQVPKGSRPKGACHKCPKGPGPNKKKRKKLGQFSGSKPSGLSHQRALFKFREALDKSLTGF
jgi:hypothetical protein